MNKLIGSHTSPFVRKVRIVAAEKHVDYEFVVDVPWEAGTQVPEHNPLGKVPVWITEDSRNLYDSRVIVEHLDHISPVHPLIPRETRPYITVKRWEALADGITDAAVLVFMERKRPATQQSPEWIARQIDKVNRGLAALATDLGKNDWCAAGTYTLADIAVGCTLGYLDLRFAEEIDWRRSNPLLSKLFDRLMKKHSFKETVPVA
jgi:glutathione S-transferase